MNLIRQKFTPLIIILLSGIVGGFLTYLIGINPLFWLVPVLAALLAAILNKPRIGIILLVFSVFLSPRFTVGMLAYERALDLRIDDFLIMIICLVWLCRAYLTGQLRLNTGHIGIPMAIYVAICAISTCVGILFGWVVPIRAVFYFGKEMEFFLLFLTIATAVKDRVGAREVFTAFLICTLIQAVWMNYQLFSGHPFGIYGAQGFFEQGVVASGASCLFGLAVLFAVFAIGNKTIEQAVWYCILIGILMVGMLGVGSRTTLAGFIGVMLALVIWLGWRILPRFPTVTLAIVLVIVGVFTVSKLHPYALHRILFMPAIEHSYTGRMIGWGAYLALFLKNPLLGLGKSVTPMYVGATCADNNYVRLLAEVGILGTVAFFWLVIKASRISWYRSRRASNRLAKVTGLAFVCCTVGMLLMSLFADVFMVVRVAGPYWLLGGLALGSWVDT